MCPKNSKNGQIGAPLSISLLEVPLGHAKFKSKVQKNWIKKIFNYIYKYIIETICRHDIALLSYLLLEVHSYPINFLECTSVLPTLLSALPSYLLFDVQLYPTIFFKCYSELTTSESALRSYLLLKVKCLS